VQRIYHLMEIAPMTTLSTPSSRVDTALAVLRVVIGAIFIAHGAQKLFVFGLAGITGGFAQMGVPLPAVTAPVVSVLEFFGGLALLLGLQTRVVAIGLALDMLGAILFVHLKGGFFAPKGIEFPLSLFGCAIALALAGAGYYSLDRVLAERRGTR
jgi:putative oxidoreductase